MPRFTVPRLFIITTLLFYFRPGSGASTDALPSWPPSLRGFARVRGDEGRPATTTPQPDTVGSSYMPGSDESRVIPSDHHSITYMLTDRVYTSSPRSDGMYVGHTSQLVDPITAVGPGTSRVSASLSLYSNKKPPPYADQAGNEVESEEMTPNYSASISTATPMRMLHESSYAPLRVGGKPTNAIRSTLQWALIAL